MGSVTYKNGFYNPDNRNSKEFFTSHGKPQKHAGYLIFKYSENEYHIVDPDTMICENIYAGMNGAKLFLDKSKNFYCLLEKETSVPKCTIQCAACIGRI